MFRQQGVALRRADRPTAAVDELKKALTKLKKDVDGLSDDEPLARTERDAADLLERAFATAKQVADRGGYEPTDLPPLFRTRFTSKDGKGLAIFANPKGDIWNAATAETFARKVQEVAPEMSGLAVTVHEHMRMIKEGFAKASLLSVGMVLIVLFIGFRRIEDVLFAVLPVAIGVSWLRTRVGAEG